MSKQICQRWSFLSLFIVCVAVLIASCGSGGGGSPEPVTPSNTPPVAHAGADQTVHAGAVVSLDAKGSTDADGDTLTYSWRLESLPEGSVATLSDAAVATPSFTADKVGTYVVGLTVSDGKESASATVAVQSINTAPVSNAGHAKAVKVGGVVVLDGSASKDADNDPLTYNWSFDSYVVAKPELSNPTSASPQFTPTEAGPYVLTLEVSDGFESDSSTVTITVYTLTDPVPDTGQVTCYDVSGAEIDPCPSEGEPLYGQDASYTTNPQSYTRLDADGAEHTGSDPWASDPWLMVRDNVTGLVWEVKGGTGSVNDKASTYTWAERETFINALNTAKFGGYADWRMPSIKELSTLVHAGKVNPAINTDYFINTQSSGYWSSTSYANDTVSAWHVYFYYGYVHYYDKTLSYYVRAVRGGQ